MAELNENEVRESTTAEEVLALQRGYKEYQLRQMTNERDDAKFEAYQAREKLAEQLQLTIEVEDARDAWRAQSVERGRVVDRMSEELKATAIERDTFKAALESSVKEREKLRGTRFDLDWYEKNYPHVVENYTRTKVALDKCREESRVLKLQNEDLEHALAIERESRKIEFDDIKRKNEELCKSDLDAAVDFSREWKDINKKNKLIEELEANLREVTGQRDAAKTMVYDLQVKLEESARFPTSHIWDTAASKWVPVEAVQQLVEDRNKELKDCREVILKQNADLKDREADIEAREHQVQSQALLISDVKNKLSESRKSFIKLEGEVKRSLKEHEGDQERITDLAAANLYLEEMRKNQKISIERYQKRETELLSEISRLNAVLAYSNGGRKPAIT